MSDTIARVWAPAEPPREGFVLAHKVEAHRLRRDGDSRMITVPVHHGFAKWLMDLANREPRVVPALTIDTDEGRWSGALKDWTIRKPVEDEHTGRTAWELESCWRDPQVAFPAFVWPELPA